MAETDLEPVPRHVFERAFLVCDRLRFANLRACSGLNALQASVHAATVGILDCLQKMFASSWTGIARLWNHP